MLIDFRVKNFKSIGDEVTLSMVASSDSQLCGNLINDPEILGARVPRLLRSALIFGANASGKSNLCQALFYMRRLVVGSASELNPGDDLPGVDPFRLSARLQDEPSEFQVNVAIGEWIYGYGFAATSKQVTRERLTRTKNAPKHKPVELFDRSGPDKDKWEFKSALRRHKKLLQDRTRDNGLILSKAAQESVDELVPLYNWFRNRLNVVNMVNGPLAAELRLAEVCHSGRLQSGILSAVARVADPGVVAVKTESKHHVLSDHLRKLIVAEERLDEKDVPVEFDQAELRLVRQQNDSESTVAFDADAESNGTHRFLALAQLLLDAFKSGQTLVIDELECSLHPNLARLIVDVANDSQLGSQGAQFILSTHDTNLINLAKLRRDQIYLVEKGPDHQTDLFSLYDLPRKPKLDAAAEKRYLAGRFGGVPDLGNLRRAIANALACEGADGEKQAQEKQPEKT
jgi:AAA15 family ATPase/GTPase